MPGAHDRAELELVARRVFRRLAHRGLDDGDLSLADHQHRHGLHADEIGIERVGSVEKRIVLQADPPAAVQELLVVLIVVVPLVLIADQHIRDLRVAAAGRLHLAHVIEAAHPARDVAGGQWFSLQGFDDADDIDDLFSTAFVDPDGFDHPQRQLRGLESKERRPEAGTVLGVDRQPKAAALGEHEECDRMQRQDRSRRKHRPLHTLLSALRDEGTDVGELTKFRLVDAGLPSRWQRRTGLCDHEADFAGRDLHPRVFLDVAHRPYANGNARHQQVSLISGFTVKCDGTTLGTSGAKAADHQPHFVGTDAMNRQ